MIKVGIFNSKDDVITSVLGMSLYCCFKDLNKTVSLIDNINNNNNSIYKNANIEINIYNKQTLHRNINFKLNNIIIVPTACDLITIENFVRFTLPIISDIKNKTMVILNEYKENQSTEFLSMIKKDYWDTEIYQINAIKENYLNYMPIAKKILETYNLEINKNETKITEITV